jgi:transcriptional regulator
MLDVLEPGSGTADPIVHERKLEGILGLRLVVRDVSAKFKYGGNVDAEHRLAVAERLAERGGSGDAAARRHLLRRLSGQPLF